jgi:hypothetical protein
MYYKIPGGSMERIQGYECQLPPVGYGKNRLTGEVEYIGVIKGPTKTKEQKWRRFEMPKDWEKKRKIELAKQKDDPDHYDPSLEKYRAEHWKYRNCGCWVMINGKEVYIPRSYYMYLQWCPLDSGYPTYRDTDRRFYCVWELAEEDPRCAGLVDIERRRMGKTYKSGAILLDRTSISKNHHAGIQSKTAADAKQVFLKTVIPFFKKWPDFFRPVFDTSKGLTPTSELRFFQTTIKGNRALDVVDAPELESWIDWGSMENFHYDGSKLGTYVMDEFGKTMDVSVWDRWQVVRFCMDQDGEWCGKALLTSTIEEMENGGADAKKIWDSSDPLVRDDNGRTKSGLYRFFLPAFETTFFDEFGMPDVEKAKTFYLNQRAGLASDPRALSAIIRKSPFSVEEAFRIDGDRCLYDSMKLNEQLDWLSWKENITERGNFEWENGERFTKVIWKKKDNGRWEMPTGFKMEEPNKVIKNNNRFQPNNGINFVMGCDPFKYDKVKDNRRSDCSAFVFKKFDIRDDFFNEAFVCQYTYRAPTTAMQYEDLLKMAWYFGCQILFESNIDNWREYFKSPAKSAVSCEPFLMKLPGEDDYGLYSDGHGKTHQLICDLTEDYIDRNIKKVFFKKLIQEWLEFTIDKTTAFDRAMASGYTLVAAKKKSYRNTGEYTRDVTEYMKIYKAV